MTEAAGRTGTERAAADAVGRATGSSGSSGAARRGARISGWIASSIAGVAAFLLLWSNAGPQPLFDLGLIGGGLVVLSGVAWLVALLFAIVSRTLASGLILAPALVAVAIALIALGVPSRVGFELARPTFEAAIESGTCPERAGPFAISGCSSENGVHYFGVADAGFMNSVGYVYVPPGVEVPSYDAMVEGRPVVTAPIADGWYIAVIAW